MRTANLIRAPERNARAAFIAKVRDALARTLPVSPLPRYAQLAQIVEEMIRAGRLEPGQQLPPESALAAATPLSLGTVQKAMATLERHGMISREHGKGTFVRRPPRELRDLWHFRFLAADGETVLPVYPRVVEIARIAVEGPWSRFLAARAGCVRVTRIVDVDEQFFVASEFYVDAARCEPLLALSPEQLEGAHIREFLRDRCGLDTAHVVEQVSCERFPRAIAAKLELTAKALGLVCRIRAYDRDERPTSFHVIYAPPGARPLEMRETKP